MTARVAWITGGGRGIGRSSAVALARQGVDVAVTSRSRAELDETVAAARAEGARALAAPADVTDRDGLAAAYSSIARDLGPPDILVNGAGLARSETFLRTTPEFLRSMLDLNLMGAFHATQLALPHMLEAGWGRIVNVASVAGKVGHPYVSAYTASKHALVGLTRAIASEVATHGVTVNAVCPGFVNSRMTEDNLAHMAQKTKRSLDDLRRRIEQFSPQHRLIEPDEVADLVAHLCGDGARGIHGQAITVDGGGVQW